MRHWDVLGYSVCLASVQDCKSGCYPQDNMGLGHDSQSCAMHKCCKSQSCSGLLWTRRAMRKQSLLVPGPVTGPLVVTPENTFLYSCAPSHSLFLPTGSRPALWLCCLQGRKGPPVALAAGDLAGDMELLAVTAPEEAGKDATASQAEVEGAQKAAAMSEAESLVGAGLGRKVIASEGAAAIVVGALESPAAERVAEAFARAAERIAVPEVAKVLQSAIAEVGTPAAQGAWWGGGSCSTCSSGVGSQIPMAWEAAAPVSELTLTFQPCSQNASDGSDHTSTWHWAMGRDFYFGKIENNVKKKVPEILAESLCSFPIWFPSVFQMSFFSS